MATKTISLHIEAPERRRAARRFPGESLSQVILRAHWEDDTLTAAQLLERSRKIAHFSQEELDRIEEQIEADRPPGDKWGRALVTRNLDHPNRVPELELIPY